MLCVGAPPVNSRPLYGVHVRCVASSLCLRVSHMLHFFPRPSFNCHRKKTKGGNSGAADESNSNSNSTSRGGEGAAGVGGAGGSNEDELDEIDRSLREISVETGIEIKTRGNVDEDAAPGSVAAIKTLLSVERRHLSADNEMRAIFGKGAIRGGGGGAERVGAGGRDHRAKVHLRKTSLANPKQDWPRMGKTGIRMETVDPAAGASASLADGSVQMFRLVEKTLEEEEEEERRKKRRKKGEKMYPWQPAKYRVVLWRPLKAAPWICADVGWSINNDVSLAGSRIPKNIRPPSLSFCRPVEIPLATENLLEDTDGLRRHP